jgi:hypothetical protein
MENGLYALEFGTPVGSTGSGVAVFSGQRVLGGDDRFYYDGTLHDTSDGIEADVLVSRHHSGGESVFGSLSEFRLHLSGKAVGPRFSLTGGIEGQPAQRITVQCLKLAGL